MSRGNAPPEGGYSVATAQESGARRYRQLKFEDGGKYKGFCHDNGIPEGVGESTSPSGDCYRGNFRRGEPHGRGTHTSTSGEVYNGEFGQVRRTAD